MPAAPTKTPDQSKRKKNRPFKPPKKVSCRLCESKHNTFQCELSVKDRMAAVNSKHLCLNCLRSGHSATQCQSQWRCSVCRELHHTTLHRAPTLQLTQLLPAPSVASAGTPQSSHVTSAATVCEEIQQCESSATPSPSSSAWSLTSENKENPNETLHSFHSQIDTVSSSHSQNPVVLKTAVASVQNGEFIRKANIFIDEGSSLSYMTTRLAKELCIKPRCSKTVHINTFGGTVSTSTYAVGSVCILTDEGAVKVDVIVTPIDRRNLAASLNSPHITKLQLADDFRQDYFHVNLLIGLDSVRQSVNQSTAG